MVIKRSSAREVAGLLADLESGPEPARQAAAARLAVIGTRAVEGLLSLLASGAAGDARAAALAALEAIGDPRAADAALACLDRNEPALVAPAAGVLRRLLDSPRGTEVLDRLAAAALDAGRPEPVRLAALDALGGMPPRVLEPIAKRLRGDPSVAVRGMLAGNRGQAVRPPLESLERAASGALPDDPAALRKWLAAGGASATLPTLHRLVELVRAREAATTDAAERGRWMAARAAVHTVLAGLGSTVALYDLREAIESGEAIPAEMLAALEAIGDQTCLEAIAGAYARLAAPRPPSAGRPGPADPGTWWREHLAIAFRTIAARENIGERHAVSRRIRSRWPDAALSLLGPPKPTRRRSTSRLAPNS